LAYVTCSRLRGSTGSPLGQGAEAYTIRFGHVSAPDPRMALIKAWVFSVPESRDPAVSGPDPTRRGPDPILGVRFAPTGVLDLTRRPGLYIKGFGTFPWGSGLTVDTLGYIIFSGHVAAPEPPSWRGRGLSLARVVARGWGEPWSGPMHSSFTTRLKITVWVLCLHMVPRGTPVLGYRQLVNPNDIIVNSYNPYQVEKAVLGISDGLIFIWC
jgi:hypothetical protein